MPSHPERVRANYICPFCAQTMMDGKHNWMGITGFTWKIHIIGCPFHSMYPPITAIGCFKDYEDD